MEAGCLCKVHDLFGVGVNGDGSSHGSGRPIVGAAGHVGALPGVMLLLNQVVPANNQDKKEIQYLALRTYNMFSTFVQQLQLLT